MKTENRELSNSKLTTMSHQKSQPKKNNNKVKASTFLAHKIFRINQPCNICTSLSLVLLSKANKKFKTLYTKIYVHTYIQESRRKSTGNFGGEEIGNRIEAEKAIDVVLSAF